MEGIATLLIPEKYLANHRGREMLETSLYIFIITYQQK
jgi:hypothetical protein